MKLLLFLLVLSMLSTTITEFAEFNLSLYELLVLSTPVVKRFTLCTCQFDELFLSCHISKFKCSNNTLWYLKMQGLPVFGYERLLCCLLFSLLLG